MEKKTVKQYIKEYNVPDIVAMIKNNRLDTKICRDILWKGKVVHKIISKTQLSRDVFSAEIEAPLVAQAGKPGQFVIICINSDYSERIPLTIAGANAEKGTIRLIWQKVGKM